MVTLLDCTFRDGGYYNAWDFPPALVNDYLAAMKAAQVDVVELGFRFVENRGFKGPCAYTTDDFIRSLTIPEGLTIGVMMNGADLCTPRGPIGAVERMFPDPATATPVKIVRFACHFHELPQALEAADWLAHRGYRVGLNLMQIADRSRAEIEELARMASGGAIEVLYFADSMGSMTPDDTARIIGWLKAFWSGPLGIHTHDNLGLALANTLRAQAEGVTWLDATVTGMGRGPGNARTEELVIEAEALRDRKANLVPLMELIRKHFGPMKSQYGWGTNPYYYLAGKYGIHPTYIQEMLGDARYDEEDILSVIDHLRAEGGKKFSFNTLNGAREFFRGAPCGSWLPATVMAGREVIILGTGPGVAAHRPALESYIRRVRPLVMALNTQSAIDPDLIDLRIACHPVRLLADAQTHATLPQPLITPASQLPEALRNELGEKELLDFGIGIEPGRFEFHDTHCVAPTSLVIAYALAVAASGRAARILMAGFDGYPAGDTRNREIEAMLSAFSGVGENMTPVSITPTRYKGLRAQSLYGL
ncbi:aldolase catalytic domain-containing protein [Roseinatronobacter bogoriensis]|uniref:Aldolase n=2 Tax=Roseinatronobacter bogoriensis TaxID=119542 RepID=A0A2K8KGA6_9RHOB|nr:MULTISPECIES: aldolase catalytic domain-containing protein [Rhodobaca]ATX68026.1 aldolase [Rhodobaca barguzinensis]MBB4207092.1 4-hydroxy 2-oxovalerate aldolase [Rhodobaca bogoriensis DSM 18756]TDW35977.1 4-hydroxy 2-oxovalerate aldolase [Rhodobaca barguzinensis]TDY73990.1 4-hydroxy 2-oxovalerate aldolase [Rhodobaca bogoriensis DSM 18756]